METFTANTHVAVYPFTRQADEDSVIIGRADTTIFLALPPEAVDLLDYLAAGKTVSEAQTYYQEKYGDTPDMEDFLTSLQHEGFIQPLQQAPTDRTADNIVEIFRANPTTQLAHFHFQNFPQPLAQYLFSRPAFAIYGIIIALAISAVALQPSLLPGWRAYFFTEHLALIGLALILIGYFTVFLHEMAHLIATRSHGIASRLGISHRLWVLVAEADMTGIWALPRRQRYLPLLAGPLLDAVSASALILVFFAASRGWIALHPFVTLIGRALLLGYLLNLLWQCCFFVRTDFYYVIANFFKCKNLLDDTRAFIRNQLARFLHSVSPVDQSHIPATEMRVIRYYALVWIMGHAIAFGILFFVTLPLLWNYLFFLLNIIKTGYNARQYALDILLLGLVVLTHQLLGFWLWIRSLRLRRRQSA